MVVCAIIDVGGGGARMTLFRVEFDEINNC